MSSQKQISEVNAIFDEGRKAMFGCPIICETSQLDPEVKKKFTKGNIYPFRNLNTQGDTIEERLIQILLADKS